MFFGVLHKRNATHLWNMLYFQALFWILAATFTELPSVVCLFVRNTTEYPSFHSLRFITQALGFMNINGESIQSVLEMIFNRVLYPTDAWNMVSNTRCFPFLVAQGILNRCSNTRIVCSSPYLVGPANLRTCITLTVTLVCACHLASHLGVIHLLSG